MINNLLIRIVILLLVIGAVHNGMRYTRNGIQRSIQELKKDGYENIQLCSNNCGYCTEDGIGFTAIYKKEKVKGLIKINFFGVTSIAMK